jgi:aminoglycoside 2''-phosphotransferase
MMSGDELLDILSAQTTVDRFELIGQGWSSRCYRVNEDTVVKIPCHRDGAHELHREVRILAHLAGAVGDRLPRVRFFEPPSRGSLGYAGMSYLRGEMCIPEELALLPATTRRAFASDVASFIADLRELECSELLDSGAVDEHDLFSDACSALALIEAQHPASPLNRADIARLRMVLDRAAGAHARWFSPTVVAHGDFGPWNMLSSVPDTRLAGVIDYGSLCISDPHYDIHPIYSSYGPEFTTWVLSDLGDPDLDELRPKLALFELTDDLLVLSGQFPDVPRDEYQRALWSVEQYLGEL